MKKMHKLLIEEKRIPEEDSFFLQIVLRKEKACVLAGKQGKTLTYKGCADIISKLYAQGDLGKEKCAFISGEQHPIRVSDK